MAASTAPAKPNLVFILPDRLRQDTSAAYGNDWIQSPHMDRMASESFVFEHCYVARVRSSACFDRDGSIPSDGRHAAESADHAGGGPDRGADGVR